MIEVILYIVETSDRVTVTQKGGHQVGTALEWKAANALITVITAHMDKVSSAIGGGAPVNLSGTPGDQLRKN